MKNTLCILLLFAVLSSTLCSCSLPPSDSTKVPSVNAKDLEVSKFLTSAIHDDASLDEMLDAFAQMCQIPMDVVTDIYTYSVSVYESEGTTYLHFMVARQFELPDDHEFLDLGFSATYLADSDIAAFDENKRIEDDWRSLITYVKESKAYQTLMTKEILTRNVGIDSW